MSIIIIEGQDGTGKTTLGKYLAELYNIPFHQSRGPRRSRAEFDKGLEQDAALSSGILDRLTLISDWVYKRSARKCPFHHPEEIVNYLKQHQAVLIVCDILNPQMNRTPKKHKTEEDMKAAAANAAKIKNNYTIITRYLCAHQIPLITYNRETDSLDDLLTRIERENAYLEFPQSLRRNTTC